MSSETQVIYKTDEDDWALDAPVKKDFEPLPEGMYDAVCVEVVPPTIRKDFHGNPQAQVRFVYASSELKSDGTQHTVSTRWLPIKTHPKSNMGKLLRSWLDTDFPSADDLANGTFRMKAELEGRAAKLMVEHEKDDDGNTWVRIMKVKVNLAAEAVVPDGSYTRTTEREDAEPVQDVNKELAEDGEPF